MKTLLDKAKKKPKKIVFPECEDKRVLKALKTIIQKKIAKPILLTDPKKHKIKGVEIVDPNDEKKQYFYAYELFKLREKKGLTFKQAKKLIQNPLYFGMMMVHLGIADGLVAGASSSTRDVLKPAFEIIKTVEGVNKASGAMLMINKTKKLLFSDIAVNITPNEEDLAETAILSAKTAKIFNLKPKVAMLSFSTKGSGKHKLSEKIQKAAKLAKTKQKNLTIDGELQLDAALVPEVARIKCPKSKIQGNANVLVFPDLQSGNIGYKLVERLSNFKAIGPIIQGLNKPVNDLSRGCSVEDIVNITALTVIQAQKK